MGGAFILAVLLVETGWLQLTHLLPMATNYAVSAAQWLLMAIFVVIFGVRRAFHLDDVRDIGFALVTGRPRPLTHGTFQHLLHRVPGEKARVFYAATTRPAVQALGEGPRRISLDGHNLPRYTRIVDLAKGKIGNTGRMLEAEEPVLASVALGHCQGRPGRPPVAGGACLPGNQEVEQGRSRDCGGNAQASW